MVSRTRLVFAIVIQAVASLFALMSWTDPLEGGLAMVLGILFTAVAYVVGRVRIPRFTWITAIVGVLFLVVFWALYISEVPTDSQAQATFQPSSTIMGLLSVYTVLAVAFIGSTVFYAVILFTTYRNRATGDK